MKRSLASAQPIRWIGVVVPAHNEETLLPACLAGLRAAAAAVEIAVDLLVVLDSCTDATETAAGGAATLAVHCRNVGVARRCGFERIREMRPAGVPDEQSWLATTDADTIVPADWLVRMLAYATAGWEAVAGTVRVTDWTGHPEQVRSAWQATYESRDHHSHVHGANLGVRADAYRSVGGVPAVALSEDAALVGLLEAAGRSVYRAGDLPVVTSSRHYSRVDGGFATFLRELSA